MGHRHSDDQSSDDHISDDHISDDHIGDDHISDDWVSGWQRALFPTPNEWPPAAADGGRAIHYSCGYATLQVKRDITDSCR